MFKKVSNFLKTREEKQFSKLFSLPNNTKFIDISCGNGNELKILKKYSPNLEGFGVDISREALNTAKIKNPWATFTVANAENLPFPEETFDCIFSGMTWHHYPKPQLIFKEAKRVLKPKGQFFILDLMPLNRFSQWLLNKDKCSEKYYFNKYFQANEIINLGKTYGFTLEKKTTVSWISAIKCLCFKKT